MCYSQGHVNLFASGKAPPMVARFLTAGTLIALNKLKDGSPPDLRPIAVGESLRRLTGKCICTLVKDKASDLFQPLQLGVACSSGSEKIIHGLRKSIEDHWMEEDFVVFKIDIQNAFNLVSIQAVLYECATSFPELLPGLHGAMVHTPFYSTSLVIFCRRLECSKVTLLVHCFFLWYSKD